VRTFSSRWLTTRRIITAKPRPVERRGFISLLALSIPERSCHLAPLRDVYFYAHLGVGPNGKRHARLPVS
jgi:hypothetical protein